MSALRRFKPYPAYKDSGVEWLEEIPAHWERLALSRVTLSRCDGPFGSALKSEHYSTSGTRVIRLQNIGSTDFSNADEAYLDESYARQLGDHSVMAGDLLIAGLGDEGHPVGRACVAPDGIEPAMVKADCFRFRLDRRRLLPRFGAYQLSATALAAAGSLSTGATRARMNLTTTASRQIGLPPVAEQRAIAAFLDRETARIDALVAKKERRNRALASVYLAMSNGIRPSQWRLEPERFEALSVFIPSVAEQEEIVAVVDKETAKLDTLIAKVRDAIDRLRELRTALISAAVTGKIDLRDVPGAAAVDRPQVTP